MFITVKERCSKLKSWTSSSDKRLHSSLATHQQHHSNMNSEPIGEAPPVYTPGPVGKAAFNQPSSASTTSDNDLYAFLKTFDTVFLIDDSGSMAGRSWGERRKKHSKPSPQSAPRTTKTALTYILYKSITQASTIIEIFQTVRPRGATPTGQRLNKILTPYLQRYEKNDKTKPMNIIVITDGEPSDDVESAIIQAARKLDKLDAPTWQVGIQFFQVGREPGAREHLKQLDDGLAELAKDDDLRDIVDTVPFTGTGDEKLTATGIMKVVLGSVNRRLDRTSMELHR
ncbi:von Willebrand factor [Pyrenophora tritici-repentis]|uniref:VWFA domain-containing protein n=1 Tax=Pyrenophora tritici-repentis (strain Pt-1C-BFP) TaxID=426418 RepID=B2WQ32_PYRTR|nr:uncharacterized protein PTRG_12100 [Pyrenophora tritici-repentis Pt-1C-BFP]EDU47285.1 conserved hypothetical protein [Pyrenophora tritici-repentis Pt-1C-BFP]KAI1524685.1 von Willebrand factor [Pyrenophora tritici-repentis]PZC89899.1 von Willebrand factor [Pyrenophora tritici-repentis]